MFPDLILSSMAIFWLWQPYHSNETSHCINCCEVQRKKKEKTGKPSGFHEGTLQPNETQECRNPLGRLL